jgi:hypothetical protein
MALLQEEVGRFLEAWMRVRQMVQAANGSLSSLVAQSTADQHRDHGVIPLAPQRTSINDREQPLGLFSCQPVPNSNSDPTDALDSSDSGSEFRAEKPGIGSFKRDTSDSGQAEIDGCGCVLLLFEKDSCIARPLYG